MGQQSSLGYTVLTGLYMTPDCVECRRSSRDVVWFYSARGRSALVPLARVAILCERPWCRAKKLSSLSGTNKGRQDGVRVIAPCRSLQVLAGSDTGEQGATQDARPTTSTRAVTRRCEPPGWRGRCWNPQPLYHSEQRLCIRDLQSPIWRTTIADSFYSAGACETLSS